MKRLILKHTILLLFIIGTFKGNAQSFKKKQLDFSVGCGIQPTFITPPSIFNLLSGNISTEYGITDQISNGGYVSYISASKSFYEKTLLSNNNNPIWLDWQENHYWQFLITGLKGAYHFNKLIKNDRIDLYSGIMAGYNFSKQTFTTYNPNSRNAIISVPNYGGFIWAAFIGCRYRVTEHAGIFAELGYGVTYFNFGLNYRVSVSKRDKVNLPN